MLRLIKESEWRFYFPPKRPSTLYKQYNSVNQHILRGAFFTLRFVSPHAKKTYNVVRFEGRPFLGIQELLKLFYENDFEPARFERLLAFGYMVTDIPQGTGTIIAPGEAYTHKKQGPASPCINRAEKRKNGKVIAVERHLGLHYHADKFEPHERFLVMSR